MAESQLSPLRVSKFSRPEQNALERRRSFMSIRLLDENDAWCDKYTFELRRALRGAAITLARDVIRPLFVHELLDEPDHAVTMAGIGRFDVWNWYFYA